MVKVRCYIKEDSMIARIAALKLGANSVAIVVGKTIHLHNAGRAEFINNTRWLRHEVAHIKQFRRYGYLNFIVKYLWESAKNGYYNNKYEVEARAEEHNPVICDDIVIGEL